MGNYISSFLMMGLRPWWGSYLAGYEPHHGMRLISVSTLTRYEAHLDPEPGPGWRKKEYAASLGVAGTASNGSERVEKWKGKKGARGRSGCDDDEDDDDDLWPSSALDLLRLRCWWHYFIVPTSPWSHSPPSVSNQIFIVAFFHALFLVVVDDSGCYTWWQELNLSELVDALGGYSSGFGAGLLGCERRSWWRSRRVWSGFCIRDSTCKNVCKFLCGSSLEINCWL